MKGHECSSRQQLAQFGKLGCYLHRRVADKLDLGRSSAKLHPSSGPDARVVWKLV